MPRRDAMPTWLKQARTLLSVLAAMIGLALLALAPSSAVAQQCTNDFQCGYGGNFNTCLGDTLITRRRLCVGGQCQEQETGRVNCGGGIGGTCQGNTFVRSGNRCDALSGRCVQGSTSRQTCVASCTCTGRTLIITTGNCVPGIGCARTVMRCKVGCTCSPDPRCTEDPQPKGQRLPGARGPTATPSLPRGQATIRESRLPPRTAEPFEAAPPNATPAKATPAPRKARLKKRKLRRTR